MQNFDRDNVLCGFTSKQGPITPGINQGWDLNGDGSVGSLDINGWLDGQSLKGGWAQHTGHSGVLGSGSVCEGAGKTFDGGLVVALPTDGDPTAGEASAAQLYSSLLRDGKDLAVIPNPSVGNVRFAWRAQDGEGSRVELYDVTGRRIQAFGTDPGAGPVRVLEWTGTDANGMKVGSGVYFVRISSARGARVEKFTLVR